MGFKDLKKLFSKDNLLFLILLIWLIVGFTFLKFGLSFTIPYFGFVVDGLIIYWPLLVICVLFFIIAFFFRGDLKELNFKTILKGVVMLGIIVLIFYYMGTDIIYLIVFISIVVSFVSYIFITCIFSMYFCYRFGVDWDDAFYKMPKVISVFWRWTIFLGGIIGAIVLIFIVGAASIGQAEITVVLVFGNFRYPIEQFVKYVPIIIISVILILTGISFLFTIFESDHPFNAWLGVFFIFSAMFASVLMINAFLGGEVGTIDPILDNPITMIMVYVFEVLLLLFTVSTLIGKKAEILFNVRMFKWIKADAILIFLILAKVAYEFGDVFLVGRTVGGADAVLMKNILVFWLFIPLMVIMGLIGIFRYGMLKFKRKSRIKRKKMAKQREKTTQKEAEQREKIAQKEAKQKEKELQKKSKKKKVKE